MFLCPVARWGWLGQILKRFHCLTVLFPHSIRPDSAGSEDDLLPVIVFYMTV